MEAIALRQGPAEVERVDLAKRNPRTGEVLDKTIRCGVCRTDQEILRHGQA